MNTDLRRQSKIPVGINSTLQSKRRSLSRNSTTNSINGSNINNSSPNLLNDNHNNIFNDDNDNYHESPSKRHFSRHDSNNFNTIKTGNYGIFSFDQQKSTPIPASSSSSFPIPGSLLTPRNIPSALGKKSSLSSLSVSTSASVFPSTLNFNSIDMNTFDNSNNNSNSNFNNPNNIFRSSNSKEIPFNYNDSHIQVCIRIKPDQDLKNANSITIHNPNQPKSLIIRTPKLKLDGLTKYYEDYRFSFDKIFDIQTGNDQIFQNIIEPLLKYILKDKLETHFHNTDTFKTVSTSTFNSTNASAFTFNSGNDNIKFEKRSATCFAYGQTGSGKTFTLFHPSNGLCIQAGRYLLAHGFIKVSFYEIYQGQLYDLLGKRKKILACEKEGKVTILGLTEEIIKSSEDLIILINQALKDRTTGTTAANSKSSRSHAILQFITFESMNGNGGEREGSKLSFIDLAGSERGADRADYLHGHDTSRQTKLEGCEINKSLLALKECIRQSCLLSNVNINESGNGNGNASTILNPNGSTHRIPFRQSKLTMVLKDSFVNSNCQTVMLATISNNQINSEHSLNTLRYAERMMTSMEEESNSNSNNSHSQSNNNSYLQSNSQMDINDTRLLESISTPISSQKNRKMTMTKKGDWNIQQDHHQFSDPDKNENNYGNLNQNRNENFDLGRRGNSISSLEFSINESLSIQSSNENALPINAMVENAVKQLEKIRETPKKIPVNGSSGNGKNENIPFNSNIDTFNTGTEIAIGMGTGTLMNTRSSTRLIQSPSQSKSKSPSQPLAKLKSKSPLNKNIENERIKGNVISSTTTTTTTTTTNHSPIKSSSIIKKLQSSSLSSFKENDKKKLETLQLHDKLKKLIENCDNPYSLDILKITLSGVISDFNEYN